MGGASSLLDARAARGVRPAARRGTVGAAAAMRNACLPRRCEGLERPRDGRGRWRDVWVLSHEDSGDHCKPPRSPRREGHARSSAAHQRAQMRPRTPPGLSGREARPRTAPDVGRARCAGDCVARAAHLVFRLDKVAAHASLPWLHRRDPRLCLRRIREPREERRRQADRRGRLPALRPCDIRDAQEGRHSDGSLAVPAGEAEQRRIDKAGGVRRDAPSRLDAGLQLPAGHIFRRRPCCARRAYGILRNGGEGSARRQRGFVLQYRGHADVARGAGPD